MLLPIIFLVVIFFCSFKPIEEIDTCKQVSKLSKIFISKVRKEKGFGSSGTGGALRGGVEQIYIDLTAYLFTDIPKARKIYVELVEDFLKIINEDLLIRPYLHNFPATNRDIYIALTFEKKNTLYPPEEYIALVRIGKGKIYYSKYDHKEGKYKEIHSEPYEEVVLLVRKEKHYSKNILAGDK